MATSGTFSKEWASSYWMYASNSKSYHWTGNWSRSGNTITLSNMKLWLTFKDLSTSAGIDDYVTVTGGGKQTVRWIWSGQSRTSNTVSLGNTSFTIGSTATSFTINCVIDGETTGTTTIATDPATSKPSGLSVTLNSSTYNSINVTGAVSNWGGNAQRLLLAIFNSGATGWSGARREIEHSGPTTSTTSWASQTINNSSRCGTDSSTQVCYTLTGCAPFKIGITAINSAGQSTVLNSNVYYLPPAPLASASQSVTAYTESTETHKIVWKGAATSGTSTTNATDAKVNNQYRYSTNNGSTWTDWTNANTNVSPANEASFTYAFPSGTQCKVQVRQVNYSDTSKASDVKELSFTTVSYKYLDLNFLLNGSSDTSFAKADVYINGTKVSSQVNDYFTMHPQGTTYKINNFTYDSSKYCRDVANAPTEYSGTIGTSRVNVNVNFLPCTAPSGLAVNVGNVTYNSIEVSGSLTSYGNPNYSPNRTIQVGVLLDDKKASTFVSGKTLTTLSGTIDNDTTEHWGDNYSIKGAMPFYGTIYATNTIKDIRVNTSTLYYTPPAPADVSFADELDIEAGTFTVNVIIKGGDNIAGATGNTVYKYKVGSGAWSSEQTVQNQPLTDTIRIPIADVDPNTTVTVTVKQVANGLNGEELTHTYTTGTPDLLSKMYVPYEGTARKGIKIYSTFGDTKTHRVARIYASVNGKSKIIYRKYFED